MVRKIVKIDEDKCNGCGLCATGCHSGAIGMVNGKAKLLRDDYCDGLGDCLPICPVGALSFEEREAAAYAAAAGAAAAGAAGQQPPAPCACPGSQMRAMPRRGARQAGTQASAESQLAQWPVQLRLLPVKAPFLDGAELLLAADCCAYAHADFHRAFMQGHVTVISCPKLDEGDAAEKIAAMLRENDIQSVTVARMEVPCCGGLERAVRRAIAASGKALALRVVTIGTGGTLVDADS
ncbi:MAG: ATP-binding protein [Oscillospiraceae bacterium]